MSKTDKILSAAVIGVIAAAATFLIFFLTDANKTTLGGLSFLFILISEIALFGGIIFILSKRQRSDKTVIKISMISVLSLYFTLTVLAAFLRNGFKNNVSGFILIQILLIAFTAVIFILLLVISSKISASDQRIKNIRSNMDALEKHIYALLTDKKYAAYEQPLNEIYESLKYTDKSSAAFVDDRLHDAVGSLDDLLINNDENIHDTFDEILSLIKQRNMELINEKRGGF